jgi:hypothetical protein
MSSPYSIASAELGEAREGDLGQPFLTVLPVAGVAVATTNPVLAAQTVSSTNVLAGTLLHLQCDASEGPSWDALALGVPVLEGDLARCRTWRTFAPAAVEVGVGAVFAFPMMFGPIRLGSVTMYAPGPVVLPAAAVAHAEALAFLVGRRLLRQAIAAGSPGVAAPRRSVHQAVGVALAHLDIAPGDAYLLLHGHALMRGAPTSRISDAIISGALQFTAGGDLIDQHDSPSGTIAPVWGLKARWTNA